MRMPLEACKLDRQKQWGWGRGGVGEKNSLFHKYCSTAEPPRMMVGRKTQISSGEQLVKALAWANIRETYVFCGGVECVLLEPKRLMHYRVSRQTITGTGHCFRAVEEGAKSPTELRECAVNCRCLD